jgi:5-methylcytosine-specific restriction endonuclease McrA/biotin operon repressor
VKRRSRAAGNSARVLREDAADAFARAAARLVELTPVVRKREDRKQVEEAVGELRAAVVRAFGPRERAARGEGGKGRILDYLKLYLGKWVYGDELAAVSGIGEWARRLRELRVEHGYDIEEEGGRYRLTAAEPDAAVAKRWQTANSIRRGAGSARSRVAAYFEANVGAVITRDELDYVAKIKEGSRRVRELRDEEGWPIESHIDDPRLRASQYRLVSSEPNDRKDPRQRLYPENLRARIFQRDDYTCQHCQRNGERAEAAGERRFYLEVHHKTAVADELDDLPAVELNDEDNLITYCHDCHRRETAVFQKRRRRERRDN